MRIDEATAIEISTKPAAIAFVFSAPLAAEPAVPELAENIRSHCMNNSTVPR